MRRAFLGCLGALGAGTRLRQCTHTAPATVAGRPHRIDTDHHLLPPASVAEIANPARGTGAAVVGRPVD
ncbi:MAG: hypothetical protein ABIU95_07290 [Burkholderiales bacterium]